MCKSPQQQPNTNNAKSSSGGSSRCLPTHVDVEIHIFPDGKAELWEKQLTKLFDLDGQAVEQALEFYKRGGINVSVIHSASNKASASPPQHGYVENAYGGSSEKQDGIWGDHEHKLFLEGLKRYGKGDWKNISQVVKTRTPTQVASHAQKYFLSSGKRRKRRTGSIDDIDSDAIQETEEVTQKGTMQDVDLPNNTLQIGGLDHYKDNP